VPIDFLAVGHITHDRAPEGFRLGGTVSFAAVTARRLGRHPGIVTRGSGELLHDRTAPDDLGYHVAPEGSPLAGIPICLLPSPASTTFTNVYRHGGFRTQVIEALAAPISPAEMPAEWKDSPMVLLGPVAREVTEEWAFVFPNSLLGVTPQGWMRQWDAEGHVSPAPWDNAGPFLRCADVVILSREDVGGDDAYIAELARQTRLLVVTDGWHGTSIFTNGRIYHVRARRAKEVDPTGAGDVFTTAFLIHYGETRDPKAAARFANCTASMSIEGPGMDAIPYRDQVEAWLEQHQPA
jgi:hypothetical protein